MQIKIGHGDGFVWMDGSMVVERGCILVGVLDFVFNLEVG